MPLDTDTARLVRLCVSSLITGAIGVGSNIMSSINAGGEVPRGALVIAIISGSILALKDIGSYLATPPVVGVAPLVPMVDPPSGRS